MSKRFCKTLCTRGMGAKQGVGRNHILHAHTQAVCFHDFMQVADLNKMETIKCNAAKATAQH